MKTMNRVEILLVSTRRLSLGIVALLAVLPGCDDRGGGALNSPIDSPPPRHPAMAQRPGTSGGSRASSPHGAVMGNPHAGGQGSRGLPPGHPPAGSARQPARAAASAPKIDAEGRMHVGGVAFFVPAGWDSQTPSMSMRLAQFGLPRVGQDSEDGLLTVSRVGGGVATNLNRWRGQFAENPEVESATRDIGGLSVTTVRLEGTYWGMSKRARKNDFMLIGAVVEISGSSTRVYFKGTGPRATMEHWRASLDELATSLVAD